MIIPNSFSANIPSAASSAVSQAPERDAQATTDASSPATAAPVGIKVSLSMEGLKKSSDEKEANPNADIEASGLPDQTQKLLKMIRELQKKIDEKQTEMQAVMVDQSLSPETRQAKVGVLQTELATLTANLTAANNSLDKQSKNGTLTPAEAQQAGKLAMKKA